MAVLDAVSTTFRPSCLQMMTCAEERGVDRLPLKKGEKKPNISLYFVSLQHLRSNDSQDEGRRIYFVRKS